MHLVVLADELLQEELLATGVSPGVQLSWVRQPHELQEYPGADAYFDLLFDHSSERAELLQQLLPSTIIVASMEQPAAMFPSFTRLNAWPGFLQRRIAELSGVGERAPQQVRQIFEALGRQVEWVPDQAGFVAARVVAMIINEAYFALAEGVSSKEDIDTAMKAGVNYPYGPFEWTKKIGAARVYSLLAQLSTTQPRYMPAALLQQEAADN